MNKEFPILNELDPHQQRIGYLGAVSKVATRGLDSLDALVARLSDLLFERIYEDDPRHEALLSRIPKERRPDFEKYIAVRKPEEDPAAILSPVNQKVRWHYLCEFWLQDGVMPSTIGLTSKEKLYRCVDFARHVNILLPTFELSEVGSLIQHFLARSQALETGAPFNLLNPAAHSFLPLLYLRLLLNADMLFPFLVGELVESASTGVPMATSGEHGLLSAATNKMLRTIGEPDDPEDILAVRNVTDFQSTISRNKSTEENYLRPRMELLVDLGLILRKKASKEKRSDFIWQPGPQTEVLAREWKPLQTRRNTIAKYLDESYFGSLSLVWDRETRRISTPEETLLWFARAYREIGREFGFTPGRTVALVACLLAWDAGGILEVSGVFDTVYKQAHSVWGRYLHFSGGSRLDREFLIRVDEQAIPELESAVAGQRSAPRSKEGP